MKNKNHTHIQNYISDSRKVAENIKHINLYKNENEK